MALVAIAVLVSGCGSEGDNSSPGIDTTDLVHPRLDTSGACAGNCDASPPSVPVLTDSGGWGDVTTYGGVGNAKPSSGGACNYGSTGISRFAAIQVNSLPGDLRGQWDGGRVCGQCVKVEARTSQGWKSTIARIVDKCPDNFCGIDLGGEPATDLMGIQAGRYSGRWSFVDCPASIEGLSDGAPSVHVKEGSSAWWSLVQVRNPPNAVSSIVVKGTGGFSDSTWNLAWAVEAENFFKVPISVLNDSGDVLFEIRYGNGSRSVSVFRGIDLSHADTSLLLSSQGE